ncbi:MAG: hypothetical protein V1894_05890 [Chloroflexota bacterium]
MSEILNEAYNIVRCRECPWYKTCVIPMRFTSEDIQRQMETGMPGNAPMDAATQGLLQGMAAAAQNSLLEGCPVLIDRLRKSPKLASRIKELMQNWASEEEKEAKK